METTITSKSDSIQMVYTNYVNHKYLVNRRYQRKLVWAVEEKAAFIDSIIKSYSVPLFLLAQTYDKEKNEKFEIIDGMQRLNAICSFIENEFPVSYNGVDCYFDLDTLANTMQSKKTGKLTQKTPILPSDICLKISNYQLPISSVLSGTREIEEIFQRINSYGRKLSEQEIRQAGALGRFPELIRKISASIRGDVSVSDIVRLEDMKNISITNRGLNYGIMMDSLFWVKNNIITKPNIRVSRDEELVAFIFAYILLGDKANPTSYTLDVLYDFQEDREADLASLANDEIEKYGMDNLINRFRKVFDVLQSLIEKSGKDFKMLIFDDKKAAGLVRAFQVIFISFYELIINEEKKISNEDKLIQKLSGIGKQHLRGIKTNNWNATYRHDKIRSVKAIIEPYFEKSVGEDVACENWVTQLENLLMLSTSEGGQYDFKHGFYTLANNPQFDRKLITECIKTLTAEVNKGPQTTGYVIVGVCDKKSDADRVKVIYGTDGKELNNSKFVVTGINCEIDRFFKGNSDSYLQKIKELIRSSKEANEYTKHYILTNLKFVSYYGKSVLVMKLASTDNPIEFGGNFYVRENDETRMLTEPLRIIELATLFHKK